MMNRLAKRAAEMEKERQDEKEQRAVAAKKAQSKTPASRHQRGGRLPNQRVLSHKKSSSATLIRRQTRQSESEEKEKPSKKRK